MIARRPKDRQGPGAGNAPKDRQRQGQGLTALRAQVLAANVELGRRGLAPFTFGNASGIDRALGLVAIKPSGVSYERMRASEIVVTDLDGRVVEGKLKPSSDLATHLELYKAWPSKGGIVHTHSHYATVFAQAQKEIIPLGTTHADYFNGPVPVTRQLTPAEIAKDYEKNTGKVIVARFDGEPNTMDAVLVASHASFVWGATVEEAVETASVLEEVARMAFHTAVLNPATEPIAMALLHKHFRRKHGPAAYYGQ